MLSESSKIATTVQKESLIYYIKYYSDNSNYVLISVYYSRDDIKLHLFSSLCFATN